MLSIIIIYWVPMIYYYIIIHITINGDILYCALIVNFFTHVLRHLLFSSFFFNSHVTKCRFSCWIQLVETKVKYRYNVDLFLMKIFSKFLKNKNCFLKCICVVLWLASFDMFHLPYFPLLRVFVELFFTIVFTIHQ